MTVSGMPFDDVRALLSQIKGPDQGAAAGMAAAFAKAGHAGDDLGRLKELAVWLAATRGRVPPLIGQAGVALYAATHGFASGEEDVLAAQRGRVDAVAAGAAAVSHLCVANDLSLNVFDLALDMPSTDITRDAALDERSCAATIAFGMEATAEGGDLLCLGALGAQAEIAAGAVLAALYEGGEGAFGGETIARALVCHAGSLRDPLEVLRRLGGRDIAALTGAILAARAQNIPVILDGLPALAAAAILQRLAPGAASHCLLASADTPAMQQAAAHLQLEPLLAFGVTRGDCSAAALAAAVVKSAAVLAGGVAEIARRIG
ncbi:nicotinate-nucleotide--dimethylbenzimidazole phosphoribosyltransferase [Nitratireductor pacificus]|uniref:Nicotinate-nucleotide--dimethylbenzimidazole phosphoribosyltransferase n=1 Tax=Nitratireductor pacificus pht-3B TaxID=391937 RepID=K2MKZ1_9HYPH|nr:nicotinate-nucleotide--dimethylbenzimidazole phosphoribosyltransferase [Nitratireductor pacificus]EKF17902.1 nicotinate-nucleotide--dimethylbenzimidazole phosphoribosyltransferase [Nitratireductor pacificus pht-3B]